MGWNHQVAISCRVILVASIHKHLKGWVFFLSWKAGGANIQWEKTYDLQRCQEYRIETLILKLLNEWTKDVHFPKASVQPKADNFFGFKVGRNFLEGSIVWVIGHWLDTHRVHVWVGGPGHTGHLLLRGGGERGSFEGSNSNSSCSFKRWKESAGVILSGFFDVFWWWWTI